MSIQGNKLQLQHKSWFAYQTNNRNSINKTHLILVAMLILFSLNIANAFKISDLEKASMFKDEICSYNGTPKVSDDGNNVTCSCKDQYITDKDMKKEINNNQIQCSYAKKRRFIAIFFSIFLPMGFDHFYLGNYMIFVLIFLSCWISVIGNCIRFAISNKGGYFENNWNIFFLVLVAIMLIWWILNIILIWTGKFKDGNGFETVDDLAFLVNFNN